MAKGECNNSKTAIGFKFGFDRYLIMVGIRSLEYTYDDDVIFNNIKYFEKCFNANLSAYKALLFLHDYINGNYDI